MSQSIENESGRIIMTRFPAKQWKQLHKYAVSPAFSVNTKVTQICSRVWLLVGQNETSENDILDSGNLWWASFLYKSTIY